MNILYFLVGCSVAMALIFLGAFIWSLKSGQHDDVYTPGVRILFDDEVVDTVDTRKADPNPKSDDNHN
ncbi:cbb3-type cytochrome oxidase assembly protein CcoS [Pedobacter namyangjuensis]|uniref:cbb3-type cytochrome oxidase assembly protein CcoS n=1 Tax=Pedobacter namyangjuensis TaxID=600626 RepID=UPI000DE543CC|nr:cbb3-type cytochrome oxidase assembly protein CcoS [Pedobacter namyangjuensis]